MMNSVRERLFTASSTGRLASIAHQIRVDKQIVESGAGTSSSNLMAQHDSSRGSIDMHREFGPIPLSPNKPRLIASATNFSSSGSLQIRLEPIFVHSARSTIVESAEESEVEP
eukprot:TRINITY_DN9606_c0_g1_i4.p1 TRINITY_DN9606_c0_g1~~TRINITY_DN9606_c0_g1_i4.p1  ORF type:complete len:113 (+),score=16.08 TRINITY_DN9606_c0_g1_i4:286-624(+)